jgi:enterochelin esterase-like enzyme
MTWRLLSLLVALIAALGWFAARGGVRAEAAPSVEALRAELARVRGERGAQAGEGALLSIEYTIDVAERIAKGFAPQADAWRRRAARWLAAAAEGNDPLRSERGTLVMRGYRSAISQHVQGYAVYVPPDYDPARAYPLLIMLHGGSANGNLFLGVVLGNNMNWKEYSVHLWDEYAPRWTPDWIVVAPDGFGQVMWRWMGEQDVLDVLEDVRRHYRVDDDRVVLGGLSNGGVGAYNIGLRHAHRFAAVQAIAGAPSWLQYAGGPAPEAQQRAMIPLSGMQLGENAFNTDFRYYHGKVDPGPMKPRFVEELGVHMRALGVPFKETWFDTGHDLLYLVHRRGRVYDELASAARKRRPSEVRVLTGDYRAARQHWVEVTRIERYPELARVRAVVDGALISVQTSNTRAFALDLREAPLGDAAQLAISIDGGTAYAGSRAALGHVIHLVRDGGGWRTGFPHDDPAAPEKKPGSSGPITDAYYGAIAHVYGTVDPAATAALQRSAERGAQGWPLWLWRVQQKVVADSEVDDALLRSHHLVLYATPGSNRVLDKIAAQLPIRVHRDAVELGGRRIAEPGVGVKFIHPNPLARERYVIVQAAPTVQAVDAGHKLPDFLPDYVVYSAASTATRPRLVFDRARMPPAMGYFDRRWQLPAAGATGSAASGDGANLGAGAALDPEHGAEAHDEQLAGTPAMVSVHATATGAVPGAMPLPPIPPAPPAPPIVREFAAAARTQAGQAARQIARLVPSFTNYRAQIPLATWVVDPVARWSIRDNRACLEELRARRIPVRAYDTLLPTPVPAPVELTGPVHGMKVHMVHSDRMLVMSCELAARLPVIAEAVAPHGIRTIGVISAYRERPRSSFHTLGLALDVWRFYTASGDVLSVETDFEIAPGHETCSAPAPSTERGRALLDIACRLARSRKFSSVLTPNYNEGHRDHFHLDIRPDDPRTFLR